MLAILCQLSYNLSLPRPHVDKCHPEFHMEWGLDDDFVFRFFKNESL